MKEIKGLRNDARTRAQLASYDDVDDGSPEIGYMAARMMKTLWRIRSHDLDSWKQAIERMTPPNAKKAWEVLPDEQRPYKTARAYIEAEVSPDYDKLFSYVEIMLGIEWAKRIADNYADGPGNPTGANQFTDRNRYARNNSKNDEPSRGNRKSYLLERLPAEVVAQIGEGKEYKTVHEAARKTGIIKDSLRYSLPTDPTAAGRYLAERVDNDWMLALLESYYSEIHT